MTVRVLVLADNDSYVAGLNLALAPQGIEFVRAEDVESATAALDSVDVVLLDLIREFRFDWGVQAASEFIALLQQRDIPFGWASFFNRSFLGVLPEGLFFHDIQRGSRELGSKILAAAKPAGDR